MVAPPHWWPIPPPRAPNNGERRFLALGEDEIQRLLLWRVSRQAKPWLLACAIRGSIRVNLRGGAPTLEALDGEPMDEDEPANAPGSSLVHDRETDPSAEYEPDGSEDGDMIDDPEEYVTEGPSTAYRDDYPPLPPITNDYGTPVHVSSPKSTYSALSGYTTDLSRAASQSFHERNAREAAEERAAATGEGTTERLPQQVDAVSRSPSALNLSGEPPRPFPPLRRRFSFETQPSSGSRNERASSTDSIDWCRPNSSPPDSEHTSSNLDAMNENGWLANPRPAPASPANNIPARVSPFTYVYHEIVNIQPEETPSRTRRRQDELARYEARREELRQQLWDALLVAFRNEVDNDSYEKERGRPEKR